MRTLSRVARVDATSAPPGGIVRPRPFVLGPVSEATPLFVRAAESRGQLISDLKNVVPKNVRKAAVRKKAAPQLFPNQLQRDLAKKLAEVVKVTKEEVDRLLIPRLANLLRQSETRLPRVDALRMDQTLPEELNVILGQVRVAIARRMTESELAEYLRTLAGQTERYNSGQIKRAFSQVLAINAVAEEPWLRDAIQGFVSKSVSAIKDVQTRYLNRISQSVIDAGVNGIRWESLAKDIGKVANVSENRARLIARDQIGTFHGQLTRLRQTSLGIRKYVWIATKDERTRIEHKERDQKVFYWSEDQAPRGARVLPEGERPGEPINCRCSARPVFDDLLDELEK